MKLSLSALSQAVVALGQGVRPADVVSALGLPLDEVTAWITRLDAPDDFEASVRIVKREDGSYAGIITSGPLVIELDQDPSATLDLPGPLEVRVDGEGVRLQPDGTADDELDQEEDDGAPEPSSVVDLLELRRGKVVRAIRSGRWDGALAELRERESMGRRRGLVLNAVRKRLERIGA